MPMHCRTDKPFPHSAAYIAFPLALHVLNNRLSAAMAHDSSTSGTLIEVMRAMQQQYDGVDWLARVVRFLVDLVQDDLAYTAANGRAVSDWSELLAVKPKTYLRLSLAMDLSMSSGRFPDKKDFLDKVDSLWQGRTARSLCSPSGEARRSIPRGLDSRHGGQPDESGKGASVSMEMSLVGRNDQVESTEMALNSASFLAGLEALNPAHQDQFDRDTDLDRLTCLSNDWNDFLDLAPEGTVEGSVDSSTSKDSDLDIETSLLATQDMLQV